MNEYGFANKTEIEIEANCYECKKDFVYKDSGSKIIDRIKTPYCNEEIVVMSFNCPNCGKSINISF